MAQNMQLSKNVGVPREADVTEGAELERKRAAIRTALFVLALSLMVQIVQYL